VEGLFLSGTSFNGPVSPSPGRFSLRMATGRTPFDYSYWQTVKNLIEEIEVDQSPRSGLFEKTGVASSDFRTTYCGRGRNRQSRREFSQIAAEDVGEPLHLTFWTLRTSYE
jgi:hypothetical protein